MVYKVGWFSTGRDEAARNLLTAAYERKDELGIEIPFVFSNWEIGEMPGSKDYPDREMFFDLVRNYGIELVTLPWMRYEPALRREDLERWRAVYGEGIRDKLSPFEHDIDTLAGYMLWVDDETCRIYDMINLHPALPDGPKGMWQDVIWELIEKRANVQGAMIHLVTNEWDRGPPVSYCSFPIRGSVYDDLWQDLEEGCARDVISQKIESNPLFRKIREDGEKREIPLILHTLGAFSRGDVRIDSSGDEKVVVSEGGLLESGYDITDLVNNEINE